jgi:hypothetical protein
VSGSVDSLVIGPVGLRGAGVVGQRKTTPILAEVAIESGSISFSVLGNDAKSSTGPGSVEVQEQPPPV